MTRYPVKCTELIPADMVTGALCFSKRMRKEVDEDIVYEALEKISKYNNRMPSEKQIKSIINLGIHYSIFEIPRLERRQKLMVTENSYKNIKSIHQHRYGELIEEIKKLGKEFDKYVDEISEHKY